MATVVSLADALAHATASEDPYELPDAVAVSAIEGLDIEPEQCGDMVSATIDRYEQLAERFAA